MRQISTNVNLRKNSVNSSVSYIMSHRIASWKCWFLRRGENGTAVAGEKPLGARNTKLNPAHMAALASAECSHQYATLAPHPPPHGP